MTSRGRVAVALLFALLGWRRPLHAQERREAAAPGAASWVPIDPADSVHWFFDGSSVIRGPGRIHAWFAVVVVDSTGADVLNDPFQRFETWQDLDCRAGLVRSLDMRTPDAAGHAVVSPVRDSTWKAFEGYVIPLPALNAVCALVAPPSP